MSLFSPFAALARWFVRGLVRFYYPRIEIEGADRLPATGPVLLIANHPNSLIDPVLLGVVARRPVRLLAKAPLFSIPVFGSALRAAGMIPAYRGADDPRAVKRNLDSLAAAARALATDSSAVVGIFPEGKTHDAPRLAQVKSGAARLALQALAAGATGLRVVPVALNYERKERFRSAVWIRLGEPVDVAAWLAAHAGDEHAAMRALTPELDHRLRRELVDLDDPAWAGLLDEVESLLPRRDPRPAAGLEALRLRKQTADALNHFHRADPARAHAAAERVSAHAAALQRVGLDADARLLQERGPLLALRLLRDAVGACAGALFALVGLAVHALPFGLSRLVAAGLGRGDRATLALWRLLLGSALLLVWYAALALAAAAYFQPWVVVLLCALAPASALFGVRWSRSVRTRARAWWAELRLLLDRQHAAALRAEHAAIANLLSTFAADWNATPAATPAATSPAPAARRRLIKPPAWVASTLTATCAALLAGAVFWVWHDRPLEWRRTDSPALDAVPLAILAADLDRDERALSGVIAGIADLEKTFRAFETELLAGRRSYYDPADDDEIRRMVVSFLALRDATLRTAWAYERHARLLPGPARDRAARLHAVALVLSYDLAARFVSAFDDAPVAQKKLNEAEPRWDLPPDTYDTLAADILHRGYRRMLARALATNPAAVSAPAPENFQPALHAALTRLASAERGWLSQKLATRADDARDLAAAGFYRASSAVSSLVGDARLRAPRQGRALVSPDQLAELRTRLRPGDILIERRNWYLSNAFLPGYWPHAALYVGTADDLRALGLDTDPRVAKKLAAFSAPDSRGHPFAVIEAMSEGVVFTSLDYSAGHADGVAVLRPRVDEAARREIIARAFDHAGKPYDFDFDFFSADKLVCTEVVYRAVAGHVDLPLFDILGRRTLPALEIVRHALTPAGRAQLEFIALLDGDERRGLAEWGDEARLASTLERPALTWLQPRQN
ncbi:MAG: 1-acyl-sn-glycerol-3-phosphate acyltransferase [Opitutaceae bacterium]|nr:1-acyl-sn-glycerol-3-phosphate acyltransferase [Opitutaceae bacterium]